MWGVSSKMGEVDAALDESFFMSALWMPISHTCQLLARV